MASVQRGVAIRISLEVPQDLDDEVTFLATMICMDPQEFWIQAMRNHINHRLRLPETKAQIIEHTERTKRIGKALEVQANAVRSGS